MITVIGAGLAGCEAASAITRAGIPVRLIEMKPQKYSPAHSYSGFAELVCSNSLKAMRVASAAGLLKEEMRAFSSLIVRAGEATSVAAGGAMAVNREQFSDYVTEKIKDNPLIEVLTSEVIKIPDDGITVIATGPLTSDALAEDIKQICGGNLSFYDAAAPIITAESIDMDNSFFQSRYDRGTDDYINCPLERDEYDEFYEALITAQTAELHEFEKDFSVYEGCMPVEVLAKRGKETLRFGPLRPIGLRDPKTERGCYAVVQLRRENNEGTLYNIVGFQTNLKFAEQKRVFSLIPGLKNCEFSRYGVMHRNTFIDSPRVLDVHQRLLKNKDIFFAGQITGVEGYVESAASGIIAGVNAARQFKGQPLISLPPTTMMGALAGYLNDSTNKDFQPMGANMGILPKLSERIRGKKDRYEALAIRATEDLKQTLSNFRNDFGE